VMAVKQRETRIPATKTPKQGQGKATAPKRRTTSRSPKRPPALTWAEATAEVAPGGGWRFTMPVVTSANRTWRMGKGRTYKGGKATADTKAAATAFCRMVPMGGELAVSIVWYRAQRSGDVDNRIKGTLDLLRGIAYADDASVARVSCERVDDGSPARLVVDVQPAGIRACQTFST
jgi:Holliday junction resolvase RusA-like endonuclease